MLYQLYQSRDTDGHACNPNNFRHLRELRLLSWQRENGDAVDLAMMKACGDD